MKICYTLILVLAVQTVSFGDILITEVNSTGSSTTTYGADWWELTNFGPTAVDISGWRVDDNSNSFASSLELTGIISIGAGESVIFIEGSSTQGASFIDDWFAGTAPAGLQIGFYSGSGIGLSSNGDAVNVFDSIGNLMANVTFGTGDIVSTFDNAAGVNNGAISNLSVNGVNGAFLSGGGEVGSPGAIPEPSSVGLVGLIGIGLASRRPRRF